MTEQTLTSHPLTTEQLCQWENDGYLIVPSLFAREQIEELKQT